MADNEEQPQTEGAAQETEGAEVAQVADTDQNQSAEVVEGEAAQDDEATGQTQQGLEEETTQDIQDTEDKGEEGQQQDNEDEVEEESEEQGAGQEQLGNDGQQNVDDAEEGADAQTGVVEEEEEDNDQGMEEEQEESPTENIEEQEEAGDPGQEQEADGDLGQEEEGAAEEGGEVEDDQQQQDAVEDDEVIEAQQAEVTETEQGVSESLTQEESENENAEEEAGDVEEEQVEGQAEAADDGQQEETQEEMAQDVQEEDAVEESEAVGEQEPVQAEEAEQEEEPAAAEDQQVAQEEEAPVQEEVEAPAQEEEATAQEEEATAQEEEVPAQEQEADAAAEEGEGQEKAEEEEAQQAAEAGQAELAEGQTEEAADQQAEQEEGAEEGAQAAAGDGEAQQEKAPSPVEAEEAQQSKELTDTNESANAPEADAGPPPPPHLPSPERSHTSIEGQMSTSALNVVWSFGLNRNVPVLNLSDGVRQAIMYPCAHVGIMYDFKNNKQHILQAHLNPITCTAASQDKRWLVTGDVGPDAMVNIWDTYTGVPIQTMFDPNPSGGVVAVALTPDSRYLATLSALPVQTLAIWDWTVDGDVPVCSADLKPEFGLQNFICFDPTDIHHVVTNSETQVLFYHWADTSMNYYAPPLTDNDFNKPVGRYSQSMFQKGIARALTATSIGNLVVWDNNKPLSKIMDVNQSADKKPLKIIKIHDKGINVLTTTDSYIVVGDTAGHVKFFDQGLRLIYWYQDFHAGPCTAVSFAYMPDFVPVPPEGHKYPSDATKQAKPFVLRDFVVGTAIAVYGNVHTDGSKFKVIHREHDAAVHALAAHPKLPVIAMGSYSGLLKLWNYRTKEVVASRMFEKAHIHTCAFDPKGLYIVVGCANGAVYVVDSVALLDQLTEPFRYAQDCIIHITFSHNSTYFATADAGYAITVFKRLRKEGRNPYVWHGRYRSHYKPIKELVFTADPDTNKPRLLSLGEDRMLIEYDLHHVGKTNNHTVPMAEDRIEQSAIPMCMTAYPPITKENFILTANDQFKLKWYNSTTKMCRKTVLGPTYGSPIKKMMVVPAADGDDTKNRFLAYVTDDKVGLHILPATGNPHLAMALIAHPSGISNLACSYDGAYLFTAGGPDYAVHQWEINIKALQAQAKLGGEDLIPFYGLLDGGRDGEMFAELEDLFYYAQLRNQGINSTGSREIGNKIPITEVPFVMRAMGFYPSEQEIEDIVNEIKYEEYVNSGRYKEDIDLGSFIKLYVNHRPAFGLSAEKLLWAFKTLADSPEMGKGGVMDISELLDVLQKKGEHMTELELAEHLTTLLGFNQEGGSCEQEEFDPEKASQFLAENLPYDINAEILINEILGFSLTTDPPGPDDTKAVYKYMDD